MSFLTTTAGSVIVTMMLKCIMCSHLRERVPKTGFMALMSQHRQIPVCVSCHRKIHRGEYDGTALNKLGDRKE